MLMRFLKKIGAFVGYPRTLSHKENSELRSKGIMRACEVAWESACGKHYFIRDNQTAEMRVVDITLHNIR